MAKQDLNKLYHRVQSSNARLQQLKALHAPEIIVRNEKRLLKGAIGKLAEQGVISRSIADVGADDFIGYVNYIAGSQARSIAAATVTLAKAA